MGLTFIHAEIAKSTNSRKKYKHKFLVDSGALYSVVDKKTLKEIGIKEIQKQTFTLADGSTRELPIGFATFFFQNTFAQSPVVFGPSEKSPHFLLGATTIQALGLMINPVDQKLVNLSQKIPF